jgi:hypothetical protein
MQTLITCGTPWCELQPLQALLESSGLGKPRQAHAGSVLGIEQWHDRLCLSQPALASPIQPGKPWELAAGEIFLANWEQPVWGWADSRSTWLLEFWRDFDPSTRFVLLHTPAYDVLCRAMADTTTPTLDSQALLDTWCAYQTELLRFYHRNRTRSVLLHAHQVRQPGAPFVLAINQAFGAALKASEGALPAAAQTVDPLLHLLVQSLLQSHPEVRALEDEIRATLPEAQYPQPASAVDLSAASLSLRGLYGSEAERIKALAVQKLQIDVLAHENAQYITRLSAYQQEQDKLSAELRQENELLHLQLHQVQDELEQHYLSGQQLKERLAQEAAKSIAAHTQLTSAAAELAAQRAAQVTLKSEASAQQDRLMQQRAKLMTDYEQLIVERDAQAAAKAAAIGQRDALAQEKTALIAAHEAEIKALAAQNRDAEVQQLNSVKKELAQENELLLLQLHQVQEELEHYFLQHQQATQEKQAVEARINKLLARYPEHTEWDRVEFLSSAAPLRSQIYGLKAGTITASVVDLSVDMVDQTPVLVLTPPENAADQPLHYWPPALQAGADATIAPLQINPAAPDDAESALLLRSLAPSDLQLVRAACTAMADSLPAKLPGRDTWVDHLGTLRQQLAGLPPAWRYDTVQLKHQQVNPDYEHLWFQLENARYGERHWPTFEFRLSAASVKRGKFSHLPKLEFPLVAQGPQQFENWFEESDDDRGPKFELRFDIKNKAMDIGLWNALSATDQAQALSMCEQLPVLLHRLQNQGVKIARPWAEWQGMATGLQQALGHSLGIPL